MRKPTWGRRGAAVLVLLLAATGCADDSDDSEDPRPSALSPSPSTPADTSSPFQLLEGPLKRCGPQPVSAAEVGFVPLRLHDQAIGTIPAVAAGTGRTVVVLLHQTDGGGLCGWLEFATTLADDPALAVLAIDLCRYGESRCRAVTNGTFRDADQVDPVALAVRYARASMGAERVVVLGASMGGSVALMAAATVPGIDTAINLSGPVDWAGMEAIRMGKELPVPVLFAMADPEGPDQVNGARRIVSNAPTGSEFLPAEAGHGYELLNAMDGSLTPIAERVLRWIAAE